MPSFRLGGTNPPHNDTPPQPSPPTTRRLISRLSSWRTRGLMSPGTARLLIAMTIGVSASVGVSENAAAPAAPDRGFAAIRGVRGANDRPAGWQAADQWYESSRTGIRVTGACSLSAPYITKFCPLALNHSDVDHAGFGRPKALDPTKGLRATPPGNPASGRRADRRRQGMILQPGVGDCLDAGVGV